MIRVAFLLVAVMTVVGDASTAAAQTEALSPGSIRVLYGGRAIIPTRSELVAPPRHDVRLSDEASDSSAVSGVALWDVLRKAGVPPANASGRQRGVMYLRIEGADGQNGVVALAEVEPGFANRPMYLIDRRNGRPVDAVEGPWRLVIPGDARHARWIRGLVEIELRSLQP